MTIIVRHKETRKDYALLGGGFGAYQAKSPGPLLGNLAPLREASEYPIGCVCNPKGHIGWCYSDELLVTSIDGYPVSDIIQ